MCIRDRPSPDLELYTYSCVVWWCSYARSVETFSCLVSIVWAFSPLVVWMSTICPFACPRVCVTTRIICGFILNNKPLKKFNALVYADNLWGSFSILHLILISTTVVLGLLFREIVFVFLLPDWTPIILVWWEPSFLACSTWQPVLWQMEGLLQCVQFIACIIFSPVWCLYWVKPHRRTSKINSKG